MHGWPLLPALGLVAGAASASSQSAAAGATARTLGLRFVEVGAERGLLPLHQAVGQGSGVAAADYEDDGDIDLFVPNGYGHPDQLYRNAGDGTFEEIAAAARVDSTLNTRVALWLDEDGDGDLDLVVARDAANASAPAAPDTLGLYRQAEDGGFDDATAGSGLGGSHLSGPATHLGGLAAGDLDRDGDLELCLAQWEGRAYLFRDDGETFADVSVESGIGATFHSNYWQPLIHDFDRDGWPDVFLARDFFANELWINRHDGTFVERAAQAGLDEAWNEMGVAAGDVDADGDFDLYVTNVYDEVAGEQRHNALFLDLTRPASPTGPLAGADAAPSFEPRFVDLGLELGVGDGQWGWGATFLDANRDGWPDLAATNGADGVPWETDRSRFFLHRGHLPARFDDVSQAAGFDDTLRGSALVAADFERDGRPDLVQVARGPAGSDADRLRLLTNRATVGDGARWLAVRPRSRGPNTRAIGAVVRLRAGGVEASRLVTAGTSFLGQEPAEALFGWRGEPAGELTVEWPDGSETTWNDVAAGQVLTVVQPE